MSNFIIGERRYVYTAVTSSTDEDFTISSASYSIYDASDNSLVSSGTATVFNNNIYTLWTPENYGIFVVEFLYEVGSEVFSSRQIIEVNNTI